METVTNFIFLGSKITADSDFSHEIKRLLGRKALASSILKAMKKCTESYGKQRHHFADNVCIVKAMGFFFSSSLVQMWELNHKKGWALKNWCFWWWRRLLKSPLDSKESKPINPKENQPWIFIGRTDTETETPIVWPPDAKSWLIGKDLNAGRDWG